MLRGIRGAISVPADEGQAMLETTQRLLKEMLEANAVEIEDIASVMFSVTADLTALFPALAARQIGFTYVPMLHCTEIPVNDSMPRVIRVLMHVNTDARQSQIRHVYLDEAAILRPDLHPMYAP